MKYLTRWNFNSLSGNPTKLWNTHKQFVGNSRRIVWMCLIILKGLKKKTFTSTVPIVSCQCSISITPFSGGVKMEWREMSLKSAQNLNPLSTSPTKWSNTQTIRRLLPMNCLNVFDHFVRLSLRVKRPFRKKPGYLELHASYREIIPYFQNIVQKTKTQIQKDMI